VAQPAVVAVAQPAMGGMTAGGPASDVAIPMGRAPEAGAAPMLEGATTPGRVPCPHPYTQALRSPGTPQGGPDFPAAWAGHYASGLNSATPNHIFGYTFHTKFPSPEKACCEITAAVLTIVVKCIPDIPTNDSWGIVHNGVGVPGAGGPIGWTTNNCKAPQDMQTKTITWNATPAVLAMMNASATDPHLSFFVQYDTAVVSASLQISGCCVLKHEQKPGSM
jgi:hypothetical protein